MKKWWTKHYVKDKGEGRMEGDLKVTMLLRLLWKFVKYKRQAWIELLLTSMRKDFFNLELILCYTFQSLSKIPDTRSQLRFIFKNYCLFRNEQLPSSNHKFNLIPLINRTCSYILYRNKQ